MILDPAGQVAAENQTWGRRGSVRSRRCPRPVSSTLSRQALRVSDSTTADCASSVSIDLSDMTIQRAGKAPERKVDLDMDGQGPRELQDVERRLADHVLARR